MKRHRKIEIHPGGAGVSPAQRNTLMDLLMNDTIAAISTPPGLGGIGIVRLSGSLAYEIASRIFTSHNGRKIKIKPRIVHIGLVIDPATGLRVDEVVVTFMPAPRSYTTQDVIEINCHGGPTVLRKVLEIVISLGARPAQPGEFTKRAFLGGRLDLTQAEAVMDLISSKTEKARQLAMTQLSGGLSQRINALRDDLLNFLLELEVRMDFADDEIPPLEDDFRENRLQSIIDGLKKILAEYDKGRVYREGVRVCIIGPPNVGKSTLLNTLLGEDRAIVTHIPGTTRDWIEETISLEGIPLVLVDTAGIRESDDPVESMGIKRSLDAAQAADLIFLILDASKPEIPLPFAGSAVNKRDAYSTDSDEAFFLKINCPKSLIIMNKIDLGLAYEKDKLQEIFTKSPIVEVSLLKGENVEELKSAALGLIMGSEEEACHSELVSGSNMRSDLEIPKQVRDDVIGCGQETILSNARHKDALNKAANHLESALGAIKNKTADDFVTIDLNAALDSLGEITGKVVYEDLLDRIFNNFCIGK